MGELLFATLFVYVPQLTLIVYAALSVQQKPTPLIKVLAGGVYSAAAVAILRAIFPVGVHTILSAIFLVFLLYYLFGGRWHLLVLGVLFSYILAFLGEWLLSLPLLNALGISVADGIEDLSLLTLFSWVSNIPLALWCAVHYYRSTRGTPQYGIAESPGRERFTWLAIGLLGLAWLAGLVSLILFTSQEGFPPEEPASIFLAYQPLFLAGALALALSVGGVLLYTWGLDERNRQHRLQHRFEQVFHASPAAMMIIDAETGRFVDVNQRFCDSIGCERDEIVGQDARSLTEDLLLNMDQHALALLSAGEPAQDLEVEHLDPQGNMRTSLVSIEPVSIEGDDCYLVTANDITERKQIEAIRQRQSDAEARERAIGRFLYIAAHELRNPMASLKASCYLLRSRQDEPAEQQVRRVELMEKQIDHLTGLLNDILEASRVQEQELNLRRHVVPLTSIVYETVETFQAAESKHSMVVEGADEPIWVIGDRRWLRDVLENLLSNAVKYSPEGSEVRITFATTGSQEVVLSVEDEGPGIPDDQLEDIFEGFYRIKSDRDPGGMGLGLYIAKKVVEGHNGTIHAENRPQGGAAFRVRLPMHVFEDRLKDSESSESDTPPRQRGA